MTSEGGQGGKPGGASGKGGKGGNGGKGGQGGASGKGGQGGKGGEGGQTGPQASPPYDFTYLIHPPSNVADGLVHLALVNELTGQVIDESFDYYEWKYQKGTMYGALEPGVSYRFSYYIDQDSDFLCAPSQDLVAQIVIPPVTGPVSITTTAGEDEPGTCEDHLPSSSLTHLGIVFSGFSDEEQGRPLYFQLSGCARNIDGQLFANDSHLFLGNAIFQQTGCSLRYFVDLSGNGTCDAPPTDHVWSLEIPPSKQPVFLEAAAGTSYDPKACFSLFMP
jgi:hypothetical protein